jgi:hypothetical protein
MFQNSSSVKPINKSISIAFADEEFFNFNPYNFSNSSNHLKFLFFHLAIFCLLLQSLAVAKNWTVATNFTREIAFAIPSSFNFDFFKNNSSLQNNPSSDLFKNSPSSSQHASSLFSASPRRHSSTGILLCKMPVVSKTSHLGLVFKRSNLAPGFEWQSNALPSNPFSLKSAVKADFLTLEPNTHRQ